MEPISSSPRLRPSTGSPFVIGAVDAGSNALRAAVARVEPGGGPHIVNLLRLPVRLGQRVFTDERLADDTIGRAVFAFERFQAMFDAYGATRIRAVGTSALREARDRHRLIEAVRVATGLKLEVIDGAAEAALMRAAVLEAYPRDAPPELIADLGGGSLEVSVLYRGALVHSVSLPLGTVRLLETRGCDGALMSGQVADLRAHVLGELVDKVPCAPGRGARIALCGGNARSLARRFPVAASGPLPSLDVDGLRGELPAMCRRDVASRVAAYDVATDRAEVMAIAAVVLSALAEWAGASQLTVPGVGVLDGVLLEQAALGVPRRLSR